MALTVRTTAQDDAVIASASHMLNEKSASKTLIRCAGLAVEQRDTIRQQASQIKSLERELWNIKAAYRDKMMADSVLATVLKSE